MLELCLSAAYKYTQNLFFKRKKYGQIKFGYVIYKSYNFLINFYIHILGGDLLGSVIKKRKKKMSKHKHRKLLARTRHQRSKK